MMWNPSSSAFRAVAVLALVVAGLGLGSLLHEVIPHPLEGSHGQDSPLTCAVCAASHHAWGDLTPMLGGVSVSTPPSAVLPRPVLPAPSSPEAGPSRPRSPPLPA